MYNPRPTVFVPVMLTEKRLRVVKVCKTIRPHHGRICNVMMIVASGPQGWHNYREGVHVVGGG
jgi:hypothetical protein